ncbi:MAG: DUF3043 domain-containing protein [Actinomycetota bacterium]
MGLGKNRPTPRRKDVQAARRQPLVPSNRSQASARGAEGKAARKAAREASRAERFLSRERMMAGDEKYLLARDRGPARRYARDVVDGRYNVGELMLPVMLVVLVLSFVGSAQQSPSVYLAILVITYGLILLAIFDSVLLSRRVKRGVRERFGVDTPTKGLGFYAVMRAFQIRRGRMPRPAVRRREPPA